VNGEGTLGYRGPWGSVAASYAQRTEEIEIFEDPMVLPGFSGFQRIGERRASLRVTVPLGGARLEAALGHERNRRREYDSAGADYVALGLLSVTETGHVNLHHAPVGRVAGTVGVSLLRGRFEKFGRETLIPSSRSGDIGAYLFEQADFGALRLSLGARYDHRWLDADADPVLALAAQGRTWRAVTGNVGLLYQFRPPLAVVLNVGRGFRAPSNADLFANGYHEGTRAFERGDPGLDVESSLNTDLALRVQTAHLTAEVGGFVNAIRDYIYLRPAGGPGQELDTLVHAQGDARLAGFELSGEYRPLAFLRLRGTADYTHGQNTTLGLPLTFVPPFRATYSVRAERDAMGRLRAPYLLAGGETTAAQRRLFPGDVGTAGYTLANAGAGFAVLAGARVYTVDAAVRNALDVRYRNFMSQYKTIAHAPGRAVTLRLGTSF
jgi:outer membrane receptor protein involved in Fe transport